jgi:hypothetical protein
VGSFKNELLKGLNWLTILQAGLQTAHLLDFGLRDEDSMTDRIARPLVIVPTYNERENLEQLLREILGIDPRLHVVVLDDASPDGTATLVQQLISTTPGNRLFL